MKHIFLNLLNIFKKLNNKIPTPQNKQDAQNTNYSLKNVSEMEKLTYEAQERSQHYYSLHKDKLKRLDPKKVDLSNFKERHLTSTELYFLKYLDGVNVNDPNIAGYWTHEYNINYADVLKQYLGQGLLVVSDEKDLHYFKVVELKQILSEKGLPKTGRKEELINRIHDNFTPDELTKYIKSNEQYYKLTAKGKEMVKNLRPSATKNIELEDKCYSLILDGKFNEAYMEIAKYESQKPIPRGLGVDWGNISKNGLSKNELINCIDHMNLEQDLPLSLKKYQKHINACVILGEMLGISYDKILKLFLRICDVECDKQLIYEAIVMNCKYYIGKRDIYSYLENGVEKYKFITSLDENTCEKCAKLDGKIFDVRKAKFGVNYPPICKTCRCTTVPYYDDFDDCDEVEIPK